MRAVDPWVSVIVPAHNAANTLGATLRSLACQTYACLDVVVVDDGSTDQTAEIVETFDGLRGRLRLLQQANQGVAVARNAGIEASRGEVIAFVDADDLWAPGKIMAQVASLRRTGAPSCYCWSATIDEAGCILSTAYRPTAEGDVFDELCRGNFIRNGSALLITRDALGGVRFDAELRRQRAQGCEDWKFHLQAARSAPMALVPAHLVGYRVSRASMSRNLEQMVRSMTLVAHGIAREVPEARPLLAIGCRRMMGHFVREAIKAGQLAEAAALLTTLGREAPVESLSTLAGLPLAVLRTLARRLRRAMPAEHFLQRFGA
jgi:GT2 family glycosyltransferase